MKFAEATGAPLFNGNGRANTSLIQSEPFHEKRPYKLCYLNSLTYIWYSWLPAFLIVARSPCYLLNSVIAPFLFFLVLPSNFLFSLLPLKIYICSLIRMTHFCTFWCNSSCSRLPNDKFWSPCSFLNFSIGWVQISAEGNQSSVRRWGSNYYCYM